MIRVAILSRCQAHGVSVLSAIQKRIPPQLLGRLELCEIEPEQVAVSLEILKSAEIVVADPPLITSHLEILHNIKWLQSTYAGVNAIVSAQISRRDFTITRLAGRLGPPMAEYAMGIVISLERGFLDYREKQSRHLWKPAEYRQLDELTLGILGATGDIGGHIAQAAKHMSMRVVGFGRTSRQDGFSNIDSMFFGKEGLPGLLAEVDYLVSCLPSTPETAGLLSGHVLRHCKKKPCFISIGRGDIIDEDSVIRSLDNGWLRKAVLDVAAKEPLDQSSKLWDHPNVILTPHVAALTFPSHIAEAFVENLELYLENKPLKHVVSIERGY